MNLLLACLIVFLVLFGGTIATLFSSLYGRLKAVQAPSLPAVNLHYKIEWWKAVLIGLAIYLAAGGISLSGCNPHFPSWSLLAPANITAVVYTYEKGDTAIPSGVTTALDALNRLEIVATKDEIDTIDGEGDTPDQYKASRPAAKAAGLPALVVLSGDKVLRVVKDPKDKAQVMEAAQ